MARSSAMILAVLALGFLISSVSCGGDIPLGGSQSSLGWFPGYGSEEFLMDSEISRRILATTRYISYGALQRDTVPCSRRGASYYNCKPGASGNPYSRGCSAITRCRG
ncbi:hypothetical protein MLD38_040563 [Melastoma candidum]|nr:hypothetical protein MLD38_040563 [Melastoma candidum]